MEEVTSIQITKELKHKLKILVAKGNFRSYNELIEYLIKENEIK